MAGSDVVPTQVADGIVRGAKNATDLKTVTAAIATQIKNYFDGTVGTHRQYVVKFQVEPLQ